MAKISFKSVAPFFILAIISVTALFIPSMAPQAGIEYNSANIAWIIVATALLFIITPGLAFFYGDLEGMLPTGIFTTKAVKSAGNDGLFYGSASFFYTQLKTLVIVAGYSFIISYLIFKFIDLYCRCV